VGDVNHVDCGNQIGDTLRGRVVDSGRVGYADCTDDTKEGTAETDQVGWSAWII
jgi:hypothetical protein